MNWWDNLDPYEMIAIVRIPMAPKHYGWPGRKTIRAGNMIAIVGCRMNRGKK